MPGIAARIRAKLSRSNSAAPSLASSANSQHSSIVRPDSPASNRRPPTTSSTGAGTGTADGKANGDNSQPGSGIVSSRSSSPGTGKQKASKMEAEVQINDGLIDPARRSQYAIWMLMEVPFRLDSLGLFCGLRRRQINRRIEQS